MKFKYIIKNVAWAQRQDGDVHAEAAVRRQRLRHALPPVAVEGRRAAVLRRARLRRPVRHGALVHRRPAAPRAVAARVHQPDRELLPPPGAGLRGAGQPGLRPGNRSACIRIPITGSNPRPSASSSGCPTRRATPTSPSRRCCMAGLDGIRNKIEPPTPGRQGPVRAAAGRGRRDRAGAGVASGRCSTRSRPTTSTCSEGGVFTADLIETWIDYKRTNEIDPMRLRPHPHEFELYYDI